MAEYKRKIKATGGVIISKLNFKQQESASGGWQQSSWLLNSLQLFQILQNPYWRRQALWQLLIFQGHNMLEGDVNSQEQLAPGRAQGSSIVWLAKNLIGPEIAEIGADWNVTLTFFLPTVGRPTNWPPWSAAACRDLRLPCSDRLPPRRSDHSQRWWSTFNWDLQHRCLLDSRAAECKIYEGRALSLHPLHRMHTLWPPAPCSTSSKWCYGDNDDCGCGWRCQPDNSLATPCCCPQLTSTAVFVYRWIFNILE